MDKKNVRFYNGEGDLNKRWFIEFKVDGKKKRRYLSGKTEEERLTKYNQLITELFSAKKSEFQYSWLSKMKRQVNKLLRDGKHTWRKKTYQGYESKFRVLFEFAEEHNCKNKEELLEQFFDFSKRAHHSGTYNAYITLFKRLWKVRATTKRKAPKPARYFTRTQSSRLAKIIHEKDYNLWVFVLFIYYCFIRPTELRSLRVSDIILEEKKILLRSEIAKNKKDQYITIPKPFFPILKDYLDGRILGGFVFGNGYQQIGVNYMASKHRAILKEQFFDTTQYKLYSWKHTGVVSAYKAGVGIKELQIQLRHHSLDQVNEYMRQLGAWDLQDLSDKFPEL